MPTHTLVAENAAQPVSRVMSLPELLSAIVHRALDVYPPAGIISHYAGRKHGDTRTLGAAVVVSHVCHSWRALCIATPTVWARQIGWIIPAIAEFMARSDEALIDVVWMPTFRDEWPSSVVAEPSRFKKIYWRANYAAEGRTDHENAFIRRAFTGTLSNLVSLDLGDVSSDYSGAAFEGGQSIDLPSLLLLNLDSTATLRSTFNAPKLRTLSIHSSKIVISSLLNTLRCAPLLKTLIIGDCETISSTGKKRPSKAEFGEVVELRHLQDLQIRTGYHKGLGEEGLYALLASLHAEPRAYEVGLDGEWTKRLVSFCLGDIIKVIAPTTMVVEEQISLYPCVEDPRVHMPPTFKDRSVRAALSYPFLPWFAKTLPTLGTRSALSNLTMLAMIPISSAYMSNDPSLLRSFMSALPGVTTYWVLNSSFGQHRDRDSDAQDAFNCLIDGLAPGLTANGQEHTPFPRLRTVGVCVSAGDDNSWLFKSLSRVLAGRLKAAGVLCLESLSLPSIPRPGPEDHPSAAQLDSLVGTVYWSAGEVDSDPAAGIDTHV